MESESDKPTGDLETLRADYAQQTGQPFTHFFCPILFRDEKVPLCRAHVINKAFPDSDRTRTLQREDVDSFYGSKFERDFVLLHLKGKLRPEDVLSDRRLARALNARLYADGARVDYYVPKGPVPPQHTPGMLARDGVPLVPIAFKAIPAARSSAAQRKWTVAFSADLRLPTLVSVLKAAHLTLFSMLGYGYALSSAGRFLGFDVLGQFFLANADRERTTVMEAAADHFGEFADLVRPMQQAPPNCAGTITDGRLALCYGSFGSWALMVYVRTGTRMFAVLVPTFQSADGAALFVHHLSERIPRFEIRFATHRAGSLEIEAQSQRIEWPAARFDDPLSDDARDAAPPPPASPPP